MVNSTYLVVVVGPTAVGKTEVCIQLAKQLNTEIVSADSRQFFKEMEIGTAKPSVEELKKVKHHFINSHSITEDINAGGYEKDALLLLDELFKEHKVVILTGGSGLYVNAVTRGMGHMPKIDNEIRTEYNSRLDLEGITALASELQQVDPAYYDVVDKHNPQRIIRALEVYKSTGRPYSEFRKPSGVERPFQVIKIGLDRPREEIYERIEERMEQMIEQGLFEEAKLLYKYRNHNALQTVGYKEIFDFLEGKYDRAEAIRLLKRNSRRYAKRQLTWFRKEEDVSWYHPNEWKKILTDITIRMEKGKLA